LAIQRTPITADPWHVRMSQQLNDWYDPANSPAFTKTSILLTANTVWMTTLALELACIQVMIDGCVVWYCNSSLMRLNGVSCWCCLALRGRKAWKYRPKTH
jgi:hypothetical protein